MHSKKLKKSITFEVVGSEKGRPTKTWKEILDMDKADLHLKPTDTMDHDHMAFK